MGKRFKTQYPGIFYRMVNRRGKPGKKQKSFFIIFKVRGKGHEEKAGLQFDDGMSAAKASRIRAQRIEKKRPSPKERRERARWTFNALWDEYVRLRETVDHADVSRFKTYVQPTIGSRRPDEIEPKHIRRIKEGNLAGKSDATVYAVLALIGRIASFGAEEEHCEGLSFKIKKPKVDNEVTECLTQAELKRFMAVLDANPGDVAASLKMALYTGLRRKEIFKLVWSDIDFELGFIRLRDPKGKKDQNIPLNAAARKLIEGQPGDRDLVFGYKDPQRAYEHARKLKEKARLPEDFRIYHGLRHTFASMIASSGQVDLYVLQRLMTHKNPKQTARYAHLRDAALKAGSDVAADIFGGAGR